MAVATAPVFDPELDRQVAEEVLGGLTARIGGKNLALVVTKRVPLLGGGIGAVMDGIATHQVGNYAKGELRAPARPRRLSNCSPVGRSPAPHDSDRLKSSCALPD